MKNSVFSSTFFGTYLYTFRSVHSVSKRLSWWVVSAEHDDEEPGTFQCNVYSLSFHGKFGDVRLLDRVHSERIFIRSKSPVIAARIVLRHFLTDYYTDNDLPF